MNYTWFLVLHNEVKQLEQPISPVTPVNLCLNNTVLFPVLPLLSGESLGARLVIIMQTNTAIFSNYIKLLQSFVIAWVTL